MVWKGGNSAQKCVRCHAGRGQTLPRTAKLVLGDEICSMRHTTAHVNNAVCGVATVHQHACMHASIIHPCTAHTTAHAALGNLPCGGTQHGKG